MNMNCVRCPASLDGRTPRFELLHQDDDGSKEHCVCVECFGLLQAKRGCQPHFKCPLDSCLLGKVIGHCCWKRTTKTTRATEIISKTVQRQPPVYITSPSVIEDPCRSFCLQEESFQKSHLLFSVQWYDEPGCVRSLVVPVPFLENCESYEEATKAKLVDLMTLLYHVFFSPETEICGNQLISSMDDVEAFILNDRSL